MIKVLIDMDTGVDDSIALLYALNHPEVEVVGITTICGNTDEVTAAENTLSIIELANVSYPIPVVVGASRPLVGTYEGPTKHIHGDNGIGNVKLAKAKQRPLLLDPSDFIYETLKKHDGQVVVVALGPPTNIANALTKYPDLKKHVKKLVMMGGTVSMRGNVAPMVEANFKGDPEACDQIFLSGMDVTVVGLDVTMKTILKKDHIDILEKYCSDKCKSAVQYMKEALVYYFNGNRIQNFFLDECPLHDPLAMVAAVRPYVITTQKRKARVECGGSYSRGMIVTDLRERPFLSEYVEFAMDVDDKRAIKELLSVFQ